MINIIYYNLLLFQFSIFKYLILCIINCKLFVAHYLLGFIIKSFAPLYIPVKVIAIGLDAEARVERQDRTL